jgi:lipopolysaccharide biosynthesis glycosyltransferase
MIFLFALFFSSLNVVVSHIDVVISVDEITYLHSLPVMRSAINFTTEEIFFHLISSNVDIEIVSSFLKCANISHFEVRPFNHTTLISLIKVTSARNHRLASKANFARFVIHEIYPELKMIFWLDVDVLVFCDLNLLLLKARDLGKTLFVAIPNMTLTADYRKPFEQLNSQFGDLFFERFGQKFDEPLFHGGIFILDLDQYKSKNNLNEVIWWMKAHQNQTLWHLGTKPLMYTAFHSNWAPFPSRWNVRELLGVPELVTPVKEVLRGDFLHWNGFKKIWNDPDSKVLYDLWNSYERNSSSICSDTNPEKNGKKWTLWTSSPPGTCYSKKESEAPLHLVIFVDQLEHENMAMTRGLLLKEQIQRMNNVAIQVTTLPAIEGWRISTLDPVHLCLCVKCASVQNASDLILTCKQFGAYFAWDVLDR